MSDITNLKATNETSVEQTFEEGVPIRDGEMKKRNEFYWKQVRRFVLYPDGNIKYYKNKTIQRGNIFLDGKTRVVKTGRNSMEIQQAARTYYLFDSGKSDIDGWITDLKRVIATL